MLQVHADPSALYLQLNAFDVVLPLQTTHLPMQDVPYKTPKLWWCHFSVIPAQKIVQSDQHRLYLQIAVQSEKYKYSAIPVIVHHTRQSFQSVENEYGCR